ncbi:hypothetical protein [Kribbella sp. CA-247076]|uniref:hypothetical protein n=1 Tax=Kribbella sp. CA-247076 TaxID=3239941 RepID=UPI003D8D593D
MPAHDAPRSSTPGADDRRVVVLVVPATGTWAPPGRDPEAWRLALAEDTYEVLAALDRVDVAIAVVHTNDRATDAQAADARTTDARTTDDRAVDGRAADDQAADGRAADGRAADAAVAEIAALTWPGTPVYSVDSTQPVLDAIAFAGPAAAVVAVSHDVPDLPGLLIGKLFRALSSADLAVTPASDGTLAAIGVNLPTADWVTAAAPTFDTPLATLESLKPRRHALAIGPGWHRLRSPADIAQLDPGLEGWHSTKSLLRHN